MPTIYDKQRSSHYAVYSTNDGQTWKESASVTNLALDNTDIFKKFDYPDSPMPKGQERFWIYTEQGKTTNSATKYDRHTPKTPTMDVYDVLVAFDVTCPALQHLVKKALCVGIRGHKDTMTDLLDIEASSKRAIQLAKGRK